MPGRRSPKQHSDTLVSEYNRRNWRGGLDGRSSVPRPVTDPLTIFQSEASLSLPECVPVTGSVSGPSVAVPGGVGTDYVALFHGVFLDSEFASEPAGLSAQNSDYYYGSWTAVGYAPVLHDGRASYDWAGNFSGTIAYAFVPCHAAAGSEIVTFAYSYPGSQYPGSSRDPMEWGYVSNGDYTGWLLAGMWSAGDETGGKPLSGILIEPTSWTVDGGSARVNNTLAWPGNNTLPGEYDWATFGRLLEPV